MSRPRPFPPLRTAILLLVLPAAAGFVAWAWFDGGEVERATTVAAADGTASGERAAEAVRVPPESASSAPTTRNLVAGRKAGEASDLLPMRETKSGQREERRVGPAEVAPRVVVGHGQGAHGRPGAGAGGGQVDSSFQAGEVPADATMATATPEASPVPLPGYPLVYEFSDRELLATAPEVPAEVIQNIRDTFEAEAGVGELEDTDPEYERRWTQAQPTAEERYRTLFGWQAYAELQRQALIEEMKRKEAGE